MSMKEQHVNLLKELFQNVDNNGSGTITVNEFEEALEATDLQAYFSSMDIDVEDAWTLFKLLDSDGSHRVELDEFVMGCMRLRGNAKGVDIAIMMYEQRVAQKQMDSFIKFVESELRALENELKGIRETQAAEEVLLQEEGKAVRVLQECFAREQALRSTRADPRPLGVAF
eukprot:gnl/TRDRNA2_/TRDRNA2_167186_c2_seq1.p1 gnl/TRDRNA2_/TRDRNA2_167186_c2~~gnl/TRDRNA2_/TRDRNA2_167186_c2_seq1.p1  ORF type:complete len:171 (+),score=38.27 gnl/TRDRNA2_/TRDRNA2_167186_c2_seq1:104-616(+)